MTLMPSILLLLGLYAQLCDGSRALNPFSELETRALSFLHQYTEKLQHPLGYTVLKSTYRSIPMPLAPGQMVFTDAAKTPLVMPKGNYALLGFHGEVVDGQNVSVPLSTVYDHHWIAKNGRHKNPFCDVEYVFGIGAESRNTPTAYPEGYGYLGLEGDIWGGNIHLLHTDHLLGGSAELAAKECNECYYAPGKGERCTPGKNGTFKCCGDDCYDGSCFCPTVPGAPATQTNYYLEYTIKYTYDVAKITPIEIGVFTTPNCSTYYEVYRNDKEPEHLSSNSATVLADFEVVFAIGHQHTGALNITMFRNDEPVCTSYPKYGTEDGVAGNEKNHLVAMTQCIGEEGVKSLKLHKGDVVRLDSWYYVGSDDPRLAAGLGGTHLNVMGYMYMAFVPPSSGDHLGSLLI